MERYVAAQFVVKGYHLYLVSYFIVTAERHVQGYYLVMCLEYHRFERKRMSLYALSIRDTCCNALINL